MKVEHTDLFIYNLFIKMNFFHNILLCINNHSFQLKKQKYQTFCPLAK